MEDVESISRRVQDPDFGFQEETRQRLLDTLDHFDEDRGKLFWDLSSCLQGQAWGDLSDQWSSICERTDSLLERFEADMVSLLDSSNGDDAGATSALMISIGLSAFLDGERRIWERMARGTIPKSAAEMAKVLDRDVEEIEMCTEQLQSANEESKDIESGVQEILRLIKQTVEGVAGDLLVALPKGMAILIPDADISAMATERLDEIVKLLQANFRYAERKREVGGKVFALVAHLRNTKDELGADTVKDTYATGEEAALGLADAGASGPYDALDWIKFGSDCEKALRLRRDVAEEKSRWMFENLLPELQESSVAAFSALTNDAAEVQRFTREIAETFASIDTVFSDAEALRANLDKNSYPEAIRQTWAQVRQMYGAGGKMIVSDTNEADDKAKPEPQ